MFCIHCGAELPDGTRFCTECGKSLAGTAPQTPPAAAQDLQTPLQPVYDDLKAQAPASLPHGKPPKRPKKNRWALIAVIAGILLVVTAIVAALMLFRPWMMPAGPAADESVFSSAVPEPEDDAAEDSLPADQIEWDDYAGNWSAGGYRFSLLVERGLLTVALTADGESEQVTCDLDVFSSDDPLPFGELTLRLIPHADGTLRVSINGRTFDAIRSNNRPPEAAGGEDEAPTLNASDSGYLFYSPATGTHSTRGEIPDDRPDLHFWPLDQFAISTADLDRLTRDEIDIIRNETFARHGYVFTSEEWAAFFAQYDWYEPDPSFTEEGFSQLEKQNIDTIVLYEQEKGWL